MKGYKIYKSIIDEKMKNEIKDFDWCKNLFSYATYKCKIEGLIAAACLYCPEIIDIDGYVFIKQFCNIKEGEEIDFINRLKKEYNNDKKSIEMSVNSWSIGGFFFAETTEYMDNLEVFNEFGKALVYFWKARVHELFPDRKIKVELGYELWGELGLSITMYEEE